MVTFGNQWTIQTHLPVEFVIKNSPNLLAPDNHDLLEFGSAGETCRRLIVIDRNICRYYLNQVVNYFTWHNVDYHVVSLEISEESKCLDSLLVLLKEMEQFGVLRRDEPVIAIGGGVLLDIAGMAASLYRRGVPYIRVPTTLIGIIDASIGAKTGINFENRRNRLGTYFPPVASYLDISFLKSLGEIEISSGLGEALKLAVIKDRSLFLLLKNHGKDLVKSQCVSKIGNQVINKSVQGMKEELEDNLWEKRLERLMDFGHSFSPLLEMRSIYNKIYSPLTHGQAVTIDVIYSSILSFYRKMLSKQELLQIIETARNLKLLTYHELFSDPTMVLEALKDTMKHRNGNQHLPVPEKIGKASFINNLEYSEIIKASNEFKQITR